MFCLRKPNNLINKIHETSLRIVTSDKNSNFDDLLKSNKQITLHPRNWQVFMTNVFKIIHGLSSPIMDNSFVFCENIYNIRSFQIVSDENKKTVRHSLKSIKFRTSSLRANLTEEYKLANFMYFIKRQI